jgi:hypothetical protein
MFYQFLSLIFCFYVFTTQASLSSEWHSLKVNKDYRMAQYGNQLMQNFYDSTINL